MKTVEKSVGDQSSPLTYRVLIDRVTKHQDDLTERLLSANPEMSREDLVSQHLDVIRQETAKVDSSSASEIQRRLMLQILNTEIFRVILSKTPDGVLKNLNDIRHSAYWQREQAMSIFQILNKVDGSTGKKLLKDFWTDEKRIFTHPFNRAESNRLTREFEQHKAGVLAAVSVEHTLYEMPRWQILASQLDDDVKGAIDLKVRSPDENIFLIQIKGKTSADSDLVKPAVLRGKHDARDFQKGFVNGVDRHIRGKKLAPDHVRAVWLEIGTRFLDEDTGMPQPMLREELITVLGEYDDLPRGWS